MVAESIESFTVQTTRVLAPNPGPLTLDGTNTYVVRDPSSQSVVVVDPGPRDATHLRAIAGFAPVELILLTHHHDDHSEAAAELSARSGAPVRAMEPAWTSDADPLRDRETIHAGGCRIRVVATPGHTDDSVCLFLPDDEPIGRPTGAGSMITGDTVLGTGTSVISSQGSLSKYLSSLDHLSGYNATTLLPGHGQIRDDVAVIAASYAQHRRRRLFEVVEALRSRDIAAAVDDETVDQVLNHVYHGIPAALRAAARMSVVAQLAHLVDI